MKFDIGSSRNRSESTTESEKSRGPWPTGLRVLLLALALRAGWALMVPVVPLSDCVAYDLLARNIVEGHGYGFAPGELSAYWPVGTSAVFALLYTIFGVGYGPIVVMNVAVGVATVWLTMTLARDWFGDRVGLITGLFMAVWPGQVEFTTLLASELLFNVCVLAALYSESRDRWPTWRRAIMTGTALAAAAYVRPLALLLPALFAFCRVVGPQRGSRKWTAVAAEAAATALVMAMLIAPWAARNARVFGRFVLISTNGGPNLWMGNNPLSQGGYMELPPEVAGMNEADRDKYMGRIAKDYIRERPDVFAAGVFKKLLVTHDRESIGVVWNQEGLAEAFGRGIVMPLKWVSAFYWWSMLALATVGAVAAYRRLGFWRWLGLTPLVLWAYFAGVHGVVVGGDRYHYPSVPMIAALAGLGAVALLDRLRVVGDDSAAGAAMDAPEG